MTQNFVLLLCYVIKAASSHSAKSALHTLLLRMYVRKPRRRFSCRSRWSDSLRRTAVIKHRHPSRGHPRRPRPPRPQKRALGSGPAGPGNFGYFPSLESSPPAGGISPKRNRGFAAAAASFFLSDQKETKESPGVSFVRKAQRLRLALSLTIPPRTPVFT